MRPIPWILAAMLFTALGLLTTYDGQKTLTPPPGAPGFLSARRVGMPEIQMPDMPGVPGEPGQPPGSGPYHGPAAPTTSVAVPKGIELPICGFAKPLVPDATLRLITSTGKRKAPLRITSSAPPFADDEMTEHTAEEMEAVIRKMAADVAAEKPGSTLRLCLAIDGIVRHDLVIRPVLEACAAAGLKSVLFGTVKSHGGKKMAAVTYRFFTGEDGSIVPILKPRDSVSDGGVFELLPGQRGTFYAYDGKKDRKTRKFLEAIQGYHKELVGFHDKGAAYADSGRAWTIRAKKGTSYLGLIEAMALLNEAGIKRFGIEEAQ